MPQFTKIELFLENVSPQLTWVPKLAHFETNGRSYAAHF